MAGAREVRAVCYAGADMRRTGCGSRSPYRTAHFALVTCADCESSEKYRRDLAALKERGFIG